MFGTGEQVALFANRDEAHSERVRSRASEDEAASLDSADLRDALLPPGADQRGNHRGEGLTVGEDPPDICVASLPREATKKRFRPCSEAGTHNNSMLVQHNATHAKVPFGVPIRFANCDVRCACYGACRTGSSERQSRQRA
jgi:hypothetical protein